MKRWSLFLVFAMVAGIALQNDLGAAGQKKKDPDKSAELLIKGELTDKDDKDKIREQSYCKIYTFRMEKGQTYLIDMKGSKELDPYLRLEDPKGRQVAFNDDGGGGLDARITHQADETGDYKIIATTFQGRTTGKFTLTARDKDTPFAVKLIELKNEKGKASHTGNLTADDVPYKDKKCKFFGFRAEEGKTYQIDHMSQAFDAYLFLESPDGKLLAQNDDGGEGVNARIVFRAEKAGVYRIIATSYRNDRVGEFTLSVREKE